MQLTEGAGEGGFPALIRTGYDEDPLLVFPVKVVAHDGCFFEDQLAGEG